MAEYRVQVLLNESPDHRFGCYEAGDPLTTGPEITVEATGLADVPEKAYKMCPDAHGQDYDRTFCSVSVGDVIVVSGAEAAMFTCMPCGWKRL
jgi:hypothetical protein